MIEPRSKVRFNREYFGYIVGYPSGDIVLTGPEAGHLLERGADLAELSPHLLGSLEVRGGFHLDTPPLVWLEVTRRCNLRCVHCYIDGGDARENEMSGPALHRIIDELADMGVWAVAITGGEPTLRPEFTDLVVHARERDLLVGIATNGMFLSADLLDRLPRTGVIISVSVDDLHMPDATGSREFKTVADAIARCQSMGFLTNVMTNTNARNIARLRQLISWAERQGVSVRSVPFTPLGRGKLHQDLENSLEDVDEAARFWLRECVWEHEYHKRAGLCVGNIFNYGLSLGYMTRRCSSGRYLCYICADGTVYPCTMCAGEKILSPGRLGAGGFAELWRGDWEIRRYSWDNFASACDGCAINDQRYYCASRCPAMSHARHGTLFDCGASDFEILSTVVRTGMLQSTETGGSSGVRVHADTDTRPGVGTISLPVLP